LKQDLVSAYRQIRRQPGFALIIVLTLGSAMGVTTSLFALFNASSFQPWPVSDPDRLVVVHASSVPPSEWRDWAAQSTSFSGLVAMRRGYTARSAGRRLSFDCVSANYFGVLGVPMLTGRGFAPTDDRPGVSAAIISFHTWEAHFASDPAILGRSILLDGVPFTIVGVAARGFEGTWAELTRTDLWLPLSALERLEPPDATTSAAFGSFHHVMAGRLAPGVSAEQAQAELMVLSGRFRSRNGLRADPVYLTSTTPYANFARGGDVRVDLFTGGLILAITFVTLIACANVANLLLARGYARRGEIAVRLSLGAGRPRVVRQLLTEAIVLAILASLLGLGIAVVLPGYVLRSLSDIAPNVVFDARLDHRVFLYALALSVTACVAFGLLPALSCTRISISHALKDSHGFSVPSLNTSIPGYQVIVSVMLLVVAGLLVRSVQHAVTKDRGYSVEKVAFVNLEFPRTYSRAQRTGVTQAVRQELERVAGHGRVAAASDAPGVSGRAGTATYFEWGGETSRRMATAARIQASAAYFDVLGIPIVAGRPFADTDAPDRVVIVNETFARTTWPGENPIGQTLLWGRARHEVVGVARDAYLAGLDSIEPLIFQPPTDDAVRVFLLGDAGMGGARSIESLVARIDGRVHVEHEAGSVWMDAATRQSLFGARVAGALGVFALGLATFGLFTVSAYAVQQRTREIGVRMALGAERAHIVAVVLGPASRALLRGFVVGGVGAVGAAVVLQHWLYGLYGLSPLDPVTYAGVAMLMMTAGLIASYWPARRAMRCDPMAALRYE
jgi:predicted permease